MVKLFCAFYILSAPVTPQHNCPSVQIYYHIYILLIWMATRFLSLILDCPISTQSAARSARADSGLPPFTIPPNTVNEAGPWHMLTTVPLPQTSPQPNMPLHEEHKTVPPLLFHLSQFPLYASQTSDHNRLSLSSASLQAGTDDFVTSLDLSRLM